MVGHRRPDPETTAMTAQHTAVQATMLPGRHAAVALLAAGLAAAAVAAVREPAATTTTRAATVPLAARAQVSAALGRTDRAYHATATGGRVTLANPRHGLQASFTARAVR